MYSLTFGLGSVEPVKIIIVQHGACVVSIRDEDSQGRVEDGRSEQKHNRKSRV